MQVEIPMQLKYIEIKSLEQYKNLKTKPLYRH